MKIVEGVEYLTIPDLCDLWGITKIYTLQNIISARYGTEKRFPNPDRIGHFGKAHHVRMWKYDRLSELNAWWEAYSNRPVLEVVTAVDPIGPPIHTEEKKVTYKRKLMQWPPQIKAHVVKLMVDEGVKASDIERDWGISRGTAATWASEERTARRYAKEMQKAAEVVPADEDLLKIQAQAEAIEVLRSRNDILWAGVGTMKAVLSQIEKDLAEE